MPVYHARDSVGAAMDSVRAQTWRDWELLLVLDGCTDGTEKVVEAYCRQARDQRIRVIRQPRNLGAARARNRGIEEAEGRYLAFLDADDLWMEEKLEKELAFLKKTGAAFAFTGYEFADRNGRGTGKVVRVPPVLTYGQALKNTTIFTTTVMFDRAKIGEGLLKMPEIKSEDTALWWKLLRNGYEAHGLDENLALYRRQGNTLSANKAEAIRRIWGLYRKAENLSAPRSLYYFCFWAVRAVGRRLGRKL
jgi:teichuronic acid biosynthesis glycosyltransferase TuaG